MLGDRRRLLLSLLVVCTFPYKGVRVCVHVYSGGQGIDAQPEIDFCFSPRHVLSGQHKKQESEGKVKNLFAVLSPYTKRRFFFFALPTGPSGHPWD